MYNDTVLMTSPTHFFFFFFLLLFAWAVWSLPGSRLAVRAFLSQEKTDCPVNVAALGAEEERKKTSSGLRTHSAFVLFSICGPALCFSGNVTDYCIFKYMRGPSSSPSHPSMSPSLPLNSCFHLLSCSIISSLQSSPPSRHFHLLLSSLRPLNTVTVRLGVAVTSPLLTHLRFHLLTSPVRF